jgi:ribosomal protein S18 acetylase RimI-like enzyme
MKMSDTTMIPNHITLQPMKEKHIRECAIIASRAFHNDPGYAFIFEDENTRQSLQEYLWERLLWLSVSHHSNNYILYDSEQNCIIGMICPVYSSDPKESIWTAIRSGLISFLFRAGWTCVRRGKQAIDTYEELKKRNITERSYMTLQHVCIDPDYHGKGYGKYMVQQTLLKADELGLSTYLGTPNPKNIEFYGRFGFELVEKKSVTKEGSMIVHLLKRSAVTTKCKEGENKSNTETSGRWLYLSLFVAVGASLIYYRS